MVREKQEIFLELKEALSVVLDAAEEREKSSSADRIIEIYGYKLYGERERETAKKNVSLDRVRLVMMREIEREGAQKSVSPTKPIVRLIIEVSVDGLATRYVSVAQDESVGLWAHFAGPSAIYSLFGLECQLTAGPRNTRWAPLYIRVNLFCL